MSLALSARHRRQIVLAARAGHPEECCGVLLGRQGADGSFVEDVVAAPNASRADRRRSFAIDPAVILEAWHGARARGWALVGFYHSHPDGGCTPSSRDRRDAWPDVSYLIVPRDGTMTSWRRKGDGELVAEALVERSEFEPLGPLASSPEARGSHR